MIDSSESTCPNTSTAKPKPDFKKINLKEKLIIKQQLEGKKLTYTEDFAFLKLINKDCHNSKIWMALKIQL
jgi:hypothetical protein